METNWHVEITHPEGTAYAGPYTEAGARRVAIRRNRTDGRDGWTYEAKEIK